MSKISITNYRSFDIYFDTNDEKFSSVITDNLTKESVSFAAVKKAIDDYKKTNQDFKSFWVESTPKDYGRSKERLLITGIRKDGRFVGENAKGEKQQLSTWDLGDYMLVKPENEKSFCLLKELEEKREQDRLQTNKTMDEIIATMNVVTLKDYAKTLK